MNERQLDKVRKSMGMAFQYSALFDYMTCGDNVAFGLRQHTKLKEKEIRKIVTEKLNLVGLEGVEHLYPSEISGGMRKRVGFARAIAYNPKIVLYDEPTSGLDPVMTTVLNNLIVKLNRELGVTSLVITHDIDSVFHFADTIAMLYEGEIVEESQASVFKNSPRPVVQQFIKGLEEGPIKVLRL
ncbi:MAG: putative phospholipid import ATP-binding protein MlaF [bacterium ADurb.Bin363]|nr:MAG: putative phospholipid import ATP-binding protein MlaF [bacterium ADurb.Bin363]